ncbi:MAG: protein kinase [Rhodothermales bacterium]|nr:protein kinase [Rhodothermales bacterium]
MTPERWQEVRSLFDRALDMPAEDRSAFLDEACKGDHDLREQVESLLSADNEPADVFGSSFENVADALAPGDIGGKIGPYRIIKRIGRGGMGVVYLAHDDRLGRDVALKFIPVHLSEDEGARKRLIAEARAVSVLDHPHICTIYDIGEAPDGRTYIAMAYYEGETLRSRLERRRLPTDEALEIAAQLASALEAAHARGIVHRDIKPGNVLLASSTSGSAGYSVKLLDFGLAKMADHDLTRTGMAMGTVAYMSPEQADGQVVGPPSDLWSLGVMLYEMLTGERPFKGERGPIIIYAILNKDHKPAAEVDPEVGPVLSATIDRALSKNSEQRYGTAAAFARALTESQTAGHATQTQDSTRASGVARRIHRRLGVGILVLICVIIGAVWFSTKEPNIDVAHGSKASVAVMPFVSSTPSDSLEYLGAALTEELVDALSAAGFDPPPLPSFTGAGTADSTMVRAALAAGAERLVVGNLRQDGSRLRLQLRLLQSADGDELWADSLDHPVQEVLALRDELVKTVSRQLTQNRVEAISNTTPPTVSDEAYLLYFKGRYFWNKRTREGLERSIDYFRQALDIDPTYARAWAGMGDSYVLLGNWGFLSPEQAYPRGRAALETALDLEPNLAEAHTALAFALKDYFWEWEKAEYHFKKAVELQPDNATAHHQYALEFLAVMGRYDEALEEVETALTLDPLSLMIAADAGRAHSMAGRPDVAIERLESVLDIDSTFFPAKLFLGVAYVQAGMHDEAIATIQQAAEWSQDDVGPSANTQAYLALALARAGRHGEARDVLERLKAMSEKRFVMAYWIAIAHMALGETDETFRYLERSFERREPVLIYLKEGRVLDSIRTDPRATELLTRMGLN